MSLAMQKSAAKKPAAKTVSKAKVVTNPVAEKVDRLEECRQKVASVDHFAKEGAEIESELKGMAADADPEKPVSFAGTNMIYVLDPKKNMRKLIGTKKAVFDAMVKAMGGIDAVIEVANFSLGDIDKYLSEPERAKLFDTDRTGARIGKLVSKG